jgi:Uma2 family endonuclease
MPATYDDLMKVPEHLLAEIIDGELFASSWPGTVYAQAEGSVLDQIYQFHGAGWWIVRKMELHVGGDVLVPQFMGYRKERMAELRDVPFFEEVPDWVCDVVSLSNAVHVHERRMPRYAAHGIEHLWVVDSIAKEIEVYQRQGSGWCLTAIHQGTALIRAVPFEAGEINLAHLWID